MTAASVSDVLRTAAMTAQGSHNYTAAAQYYQRLYARNPDNQAVILGYARNLRFVGGPGRAIDVLHKGLAMYPEHSEMRIELGKAQVAAGRNVAAVRTLTVVTQADPENWRALSALGIAYDLLGDHQSAERSYFGALAISPDEPGILNNLALSKALAGDLDGGVAILRRLTSGMNVRPQYRQNLALLYVMQGEIGLAERLIKHDLPDRLAEQNLAYYRELSPMIARDYGAANRSGGTPTSRLVARAPDSAPIAAGSGTAPASAGNADGAGETTVAGRSGFKAPTDREDATAPDSYSGDSPMAMAEAKPDTAPVESQSIALADLGPEPSQEIAPVEAPARRRPPPPVAKPAQMAAEGAGPAATTARIEPLPEPAVAEEVEVAGATGMPAAEMSGRTGSIEMAKPTAAATDATPPPPAETATFLDEPTELAMPEETESRVAMAEPTEAPAEPEPVKAWVEPIDLTAQAPIIPERAIETPPAPRNLATAGDFEDEVALAGLNEAPAEPAPLGAPAQTVDLAAQAPIPEPETPPSGLATAGDFEAGVALAGLNETPTEPAPLVAPAMPFDLAAQADERAGPANPVSAGGAFSGTVTALGERWAPRDQLDVSAQPGLSADAASAGRWSARPRPPTHGRLAAIAGGERTGVTLRTRPALPGWAPRITDTSAAPDAIVATDRSAPRHPAAAYDTAEASPVDEPSSPVIAAEREGTATRAPDEEQRAHFVVPAPMREFVGTVAALAEPMDANDPGDSQPGPAAKTKLSEDPANAAGTDGVVSVPMTPPVRELAVSIRPPGPPARFMPALAMEFEPPVATATLAGVSEPAEPANTESTEVAAAEGGDAARSSATGSGQAKALAESFVSSVSRAPQKTRRVDGNRLSSSNADSFEIDLTAQPATVNGVDHAVTAGMLAEAAPEGAAETASASPVPAPEHDFAGMVAALAQQLGSDDMAAAPADEAGERDLAQAMPAQMNGPHAAVAAIESDGADLPSADASAKSETGSSPAPAEQAGAVHVRIGVFSSQLSAAKWLVEQRDAHLDLLSSMRFEIAEVDEDNVDAGYNLLAGPVSDLGRAGELCDKLKNREKDCALVVVR